MTAQGEPRLHDDDMVTVAEAARIAHRSVRTIRRAYLSGRLVAHRDGNGRGVSIRYGDLRAWLTAELIAPTSGIEPPQSVGRHELQRPRRVNTGNLELLTAVRRRRARRARAPAATRPSRTGTDSGSG